MPGALSSLLHSATAGVVGYEQGQQDRQTRLLAALKRKQDEELRKAQAANLQSQIDERERKAAIPPAYHPTSRGEATEFYKDTHPTKETGPVPGSDAWYEMQDHVARIRSRYRSGANGERGDIPLNHALTTIGQEIDDTRSDINLADRGLKKYEDVNVTTRPTNPKRVPQFIADSTDAANLATGRRRLSDRATTLSEERDRMAAEQRRRLGFKMGGTGSPTTVTAGAGTDGRKTAPPQAMEFEIQQAKEQLATVFNSPDATPEDKRAAQNAYYSRRERIKQKYDQH